MRSLFLFACLAALTGCSTVPCDPRVTVAPNLEGRVTVTRVRCEKGAGGHFTASADVRNETGRALPVQWKTVWTDAEGHEIDTTLSTWDSVTIRAAEKRELRSVSPLSSAGGMRMYLRRVREP